MFIPKRKTFSLIISALLYSMLSQISQAAPISLFYEDRSTCDNPGPAVLFDELGNGPLFAALFRHEHVSITPRLSGATTCTIDGDRRNFELDITNLTGRRFTDLWLVGDNETSFSNVDGLSGALGEPLFRTFKIDSVGINTPLLAETGGSVAGVFEPGETWTVLIVDYFNTLGIPPHFAGSPGTISSGDIFPFSSISIIAGEQIVPDRPVPEPGTLFLGLASLLLWLPRKKLGLVKS